MALIRQYVSLLVIFVKLKSWKLLFMLVVIAALMSNIYLYKPVNSWMLQQGENDLHVVGAKEFQEENVVLCDTSKYAAESDSMAEMTTRMGGMDFKKNNLETCNSDDNCRDTYFQLLMGKRKSKTVHYVDYNPKKTGKAKLQCQFSTGSELYCPFVAYLVGISQTGDKNPAYQYRSTHVFRLKATFKAFDVVKRGNGTICKTDVNFAAILPKTLMAQMLFVLISLIFYLLVSTVTCIYELKENGFLQLMFRKQLSVLAYWLALWTITLLEMAILAAFLAVAHNMQCSGFYTTSHLINVFLCTFVQFCGVSAVIFLFTVMTRRIAIASFLACLFYLCAASIMVINRLVISQNSGLFFLNYIFLVVPVGLIAEQLFEVLLEGLITANSFYGIMLFASAGIFAVIAMFTIYLDSVLKPGNGLHLPCNYIFRSKYWSLSNRDRTTIEIQEQCTMVEGVSDRFKRMVAVQGVRKLYKTCNGRVTKALTSFTAQFYQGQIAAIVGHNGSGKSTLFNILSGDSHATGGRAALDRTLLTDPLSRCHIGNNIGYCPQFDALVDRLTVMDMLKLAASSSGLGWNDVKMDLSAIMSALQIDEKKNHCVGSLSNSDKRKVSVTMALVGRPKVILLDAPSRDLDYISKRRMWNLLHEYKKNHAIIVSTLFIDEADAIADRMLFLSGGRIICAGSSFFFKRAFDCRFIIQIASKTEFHVPLIIRKITSQFHSIRVRSFANADVEFEVSLVEDNILPSVIEAVENMSELIDEFGIAHFSLDDVFSKLNALPPSEVNDHFELSTIGYIADDIDRVRAIQNRRKLVVPDGPTVVKLAPSKLRTIMATMRVLHGRIMRSKVALLIRAIVPLLLLVLLIVGSVLEKKMDNEQLSIKYDLSNISEFETSRGTCFVYSTSVHSVHLERILDPDCSTMINGLNKTSIDLRTIDLPVRKFDQGNFYQALLDKRKLSELVSICRGDKMPCPIVYSNDWCPDVESRTGHDVYVGSYTSQNNTPESVAMTTIEIFKNLVSRMTKKTSMTGKTKHVTPSLDAEGIIDIRSIFFPFYGMFIQLVLLALIPVICLNDVIQDRKTGVRSQLISMGMTRLHYWLCTLLSHWIQLACIYLVSAIILIVVASPGYSNVFFLAVVMPSTLTFGLVNNILCVYAVSRLFEKTSFLLISAYAFFCLLVSLSVIMIQSSDFIALIMTFTFPQFAAIAPTFFGVRFIHYSLSFYKSTSKESAPNLLPYTFAVSQVRDALLAFVVHFILLILLHLALENRHKICKSSSKNGHRGTDKNAYDNCKESSVLSEVGKIEKSPKSDEHLMEAKELKVVNSDGRLALKNLTFGLKSGEIFGLLGPCACGKGSALRAMVNDQHQTAGQVEFHVKDKWLTTLAAARQGLIGYCPKNNPVIQRLTIRENLQFYAGVIGVPMERVQQVLKILNLEDDANVVTMHALAGVKRSLALAIAILTNPQFVAIDQVSAGVDPEGRQILWQSIKSLAAKQRGIIVATQYMEEAETLCDRICIMNGGVMVALNNIDELIHRYKKMYFLEMQIRTGDNETTESVQQRKEKISNIIMDKFYGSIVTEKLTSRLQFGIPIVSIGRLSESLGWLIKMKKELDILYFTIHYATIDQTMKAIIVHHENQMISQMEEAASIVV